jgi:uncharacterized protein with gpF-like domain
MVEVNRLRQPFSEQVAAFRARTQRLVPTATWQDLLGNQHDRAFVVAGAMKAALLADFASAVDEAVADGLGIDAFRRRFDDIVAEHGWEFNGSRDWRSRVIYQTNISTSYAAGRLSQLRNPELLKVKPHWMYKHSDSVLDPRPQHLAWDGHYMAPDDPWWATHYPPNGWGCQCYVIAVSDRDVRRMGGKKGAPGVKRNPIDNVPDGIDKGWDYQPGNLNELVQSVTAQAKIFPKEIFESLEKEFLLFISGLGASE